MFKGSSKGKIKRTKRRASKAMEEGGDERVEIVQKVDYSKYYAFRQMERRDLRETLKELMTQVEEIREIMSSSVGTQRFKIEANRICQKKLANIEMLFLENMGKYIELDNTVNAIQEDNKELRKEIKELRSRRDQKIGDKVVDIKLGRTQSRDIEKKDFYSVVLQGKTEEEIDIRGILRQELKTDKKHLKVEDIILTKNKKIILRSGNRDEMNEVVKWIESKENMSDKLHVGKPSRKKERILIMGIHQETDEKMIEEEILKNISVTEPSIEVVKPIRRRDELTNWIVDVDTDSKNELLKKGRICIDLMRTRVVEFIRIIRCFRCQRFGHVASRCRNDTRCGKCGEGHDKKDCTSEIEKCVNCEVNNEHCSDSFNCPSFVKYKREKLSKRL